MKTLNLKRMNSIVALGCVGIAMQSVTALAQSRTGSPTSPSGADVIAAEVKVTRDAMDEVIRRLKESQSQAAFHQADYKLKSAEFNTRVAEAMARFEAKLQNEILPEIGFHIEEYNRIERSNAYSDIEKKNILANFEIKTKGMAERLSERYQAAIVELYQVAGELPIRAFSWVNENTIVDEETRCGATNCWTFDGKRGSTFSSEFFGWNENSVLTLNSTLIPIKREAQWYKDVVIKDTNRWLNQIDGRASPYSCKSYGNCTPQELDILFPDRRSAFEMKIYPILEKDCYSRSCISQTASHLILYIQMISSTLDRDLVLPMGDKTVTLTAKKMSVVLPTGLLSLVPDVESYEKMPFDITESELPIAKKARAQLMRKNAALEKFIHNLTQSKSRKDCLEAYTVLRTDFSTIPMTDLTPGEKESIKVQVRNARAEERSAKVERILSCF